MLTEYSNPNTYILVIRAEKNCIVFHYIIWFIRKTVFFPLLKFLNFIAPFSMF